MPPTSTVVAAATLRPSEPVAARRGVPVVAVVLLVGAVLAGAAVRYGPPPAAVPAGLLLAFVLPGCAVVTAALGWVRLSAVERTVLVPAVSLAVVVLGGLGLNAARIRLDRASWTALTVAVTVLGAIGGQLRARRVSGRPAGTAPAEGSDEPAVVLPVSAAAPASQRASVVRPLRRRAGQKVLRAVAVKRRTVKRGRAGSGVDDELTRVLAVGPAAPPRSETTVEIKAVTVPHAVDGGGGNAGGPAGDDPAASRRARAFAATKTVLPLVLGLALLAGAGMLSISTARAQASRIGTALSVVPAQVPSTAAPDMRAVRIQLTSGERATTRFVVRVTPDGGTGTDLPVAVARGGRWVHTVQVPAGLVTVTLYRPGTASAYRSVFLLQAA
jgi:hypothetical protein